MRTFCPPREIFERKYVRPKAGRTLIVGSKLYPGREDRRKLYAEAVGVDMLPGAGVDVVLNLEDDGAALVLGQFAHIEAWSTLEHCRRPWLVAANLEQLLEPGGTLYLTVPFAWRVHAYPEDFWRMSRLCVRDVLFPGINWVRVMTDDGWKLRDNDRIPPLTKGDGGVKWLPRMEVLAFGARA